MAIATAYVDIKPDLRGIHKETKKGLLSAEGEFDKSGKRGGGRLVGAFGKVAVAGVAAAGAASAAAMGTALVKGFGRLTAIDNAEQKLLGLGHSAQTVEQIMSDALASVKGTAFGLEEAATVSAQLVASGIQPGQELERTLRTVADSATIAGINMDEMGAIFGKVASSGRLQGDELNQMSERGIPALQLLAEHLGITTDEVRAMVSAGQVDFQTFADAMDSGMGGAALKSGETFEGAWKNVGAALGRIGATLLTPFFESAKGGMGGLTTILDSINTALQPLMEAFGEWLNSIDWAAVGQQFGDLFTPLWEALQPLLPALLEAWQNLSPISLIFKALQPLLPALVTALSTLAQTLLGTLGQALGFLLPILAELATTLVEVLAEVFAQMLPVILQLAQILGPILGTVMKALAPIIGIVAKVVVSLVQALLPIVGIVFDLIGALLPPLMKLFMALAPIIQLVGTIVAFLANIIGTILVAAINFLMPIIEFLVKILVTVLVVAIEVVIGIINGLVWVVTNVLAPAFTWLYENIIKPVFDAIVAVIQWAWNNIIMPIFTAIKWYIDNILAPVFRWLYENVIKPVWDGISDAISTAWNWIKANVFDPLQKWAAETLPEAWDKLKGAVERAWNGISDAAKKPIRFVIETIINKGIIDNFNKLLDWFPGEQKPINHVPIPDGFARGGWTGPGSRLTPAGIVHADEFVLQKSARRSLEAQRPGALDYMNRTGMFPGYARGGRVGTLWDAAQWWIEKGARASRHSWFNGGRRITSGHSRNSLHYSDQAVDFNYGPGGRNATEIAFFDRWLSEFQSLFPGIRTIWKASDGSHWDHLHIDTSKGANIGAAGGFDLLAPFRDLLDAVADGVGDSVFGQIAGGAAKKMIQAPIDWITGKLGDLWEGAGDIISTAGDAATKAQVRAVAATYGWGLGPQWQALDQLIMKESSWDPSAANPSSSARGLFQKMTSIHGPVERTAAGQARWGLNYIRDRYGDPVSALAFHRRNNWYADGGLVAPIRKYDTGGVLPPGLTTVLNATGRNEYAFRPDQLASLAGNRVAYQHTGDVYTVDPDEFARSVVREQRRADLLTIGGSI